MSISFLIVTPSFRWKGVIEDLYKRWSQELHGPWLINFYDTDLTSKRRFFAESQSPLSLTPRRFLHTKELRVQVFATRSSFLTRVAGGFVFGPTPVCRRSRGPWWACGRESGVWSLRPDDCLPRVPGQWLLARFRRGWPKTLPVVRGLRRRRHSGAFGGATEANGQSFFL